MAAGRISGAVEREGANPVALSSLSLGGRPIRVVDKREGGQRGMWCTCSPDRSPAAPPLSLSAAKRHWAS
ncbi:unnamed protein product [Ectocarpus fasciculatus]